MRSRASALPEARRLLAAAVSAWSAWYRRLRYWFSFCSEIVEDARSGASTPSTAGVVRLTGVRLLGLRAFIAHIVGGVDRSSAKGGRGCVLAARAVLGPGRHLLDSCLGAHGDCSAPPRRGAPVGGRAR